MKKRKYSFLLATIECIGFFVAVLGVMSLAELLCKLFGVG